MRLFLCVFFFLSFTHSSSHVLHDFELSSSSSFKSKFFLSCPSLFFFSRTCFENIECRKKVAKKKKKKKKKEGRKEGIKGEEAKKRKKKKKKKKEVEERKRVNQRTLLFPNQV